MVKNFLIVGTQGTANSALPEALGTCPGVTCGRERTIHVPWAGKLEVGFGRRLFGSRSDGIVTDCPAIADFIEVFNH